MRAGCCDLDLSSGTLSRSRCCGDVDHRYLAYNLSIPPMVSTHTRRRVPNDLPFRAWSALQSDIRPKELGQVRRSGAQSKPQRCGFTGCESLMLFTISFVRIHPSIWSCRCSSSLHVIWTGFHAVLFSTCRDPIPGHPSREERWGLSSFLSERGDKDFHPIVNRLGSHTHFDLCSNAWISWHRPTSGHDTSGSKSRSESGRSLRVEVM